MQDGCSHIQDILASFLCSGRCILYLYIKSHLLFLLQTHTIIFHTHKHTPFAHCLVHSSLEQKPLISHFSCFWVISCHKLEPWMTPLVLIKYNSLWAPTMPLSSWSSSCMYNKSVYFKLNLPLLTYFVSQNEIALQTRVDRRSDFHRSTLDIRQRENKEQEGFCHAWLIYLQKVKHIWCLNVLTIRACSRPIVMTVRLIILSSDTTMSWMCWNVSPWEKQRQRADKENSRKGNK